MSLSDLAALGSFVDEGKKPMIPVHISRMLGVVASILVWCCPAFAAATPSAPDASMLAGPEKIARFIETPDDSLLKGAFAARDVTIIENFPPHVFAGPDAVRRWTVEMKKHLDAHAGLRHAFGAPQDFSRHGDVVFFTLPTSWTGFSHGKPFSERAGWAFVLVRVGKEWRIRAYAWAVTDSTGP